ncbi:aldo/keto reductase [Phenylobacterium montanum]|uniref:Aldo/keto reductase n=1 Tax=Phenylobacterium montanum TaxID=2823693 RepID=A0A975G3H6_9CAUL|nr:aldo/keto reductase [Caulobacter sp. S6]QUD89888.1 aldo/keto reductase [Caulobacter sp. S6]
MQKRKLGRSGLSIAPLMLGGNVFGWTADEKTSFAILDAFVDAGFDAVDTADVYSRWVPGHTGGESETVIGAWLKASGKRDRIVLATKLGMDMGGDNKGLSAAYMVRAVEDSLRRLQTDHIDLYQSHRDDAETPLDETLEAYQRLIKAGKVRAIGASNYDAARLGEALGVSAAKSLPRYESLQPLYNLYDRSAYEGPLQDLCVKEEVGVVCFYGLASGFLTGKYRSEADLGKSPRGRGAKRYLDARGLRILAALDAVGAETGASPAQVALAWLMAQPGITAPIASATSVAQLEEILGAARLSLSADQVKALTAASDA